MQEAASVPQYLDWPFWAVVVAAVAVVLSQIPPIHLLLKKAKLDFELYSRIAVTHKVGNPNLQFHLIISNVGGRLVKVKGLSVSIKRDGQDIGNFPAQNYLQEPSDTNTVLFTRFSLKPKEEWAHIVNFLNFFNRADEKKYRSSETELRANILNKRDQLENKDQVVEADNQYVEPFLEFFNAKFKWHPGEYAMQVCADAEPKGASVGRSYRFTLFESDSEELAKQKDDYKYGGGIFFDSVRHTGVIVPITEDKA